jgi:molybdenum cofactor cytidylyltransferase
LMQEKRTSVLVLAAGFSERMGQEKFALEFQPGVTFLEHIVNQYHRFGCLKIVVVVNSRGQKLIGESSLQLPDEIMIVVNSHPERGRFSSIKTGLQHLINEDFVFIQNTDHPKINIDLLDALLKNIGDAGYTHPVYRSKGGHPVLLKNKVVRVLLSESPDDTVLKDFLTRFSKTETMVDNPDVLMNINTLADYNRFYSK